jgi:hypothetical protein
MDFPVSQSLGLLAITLASGGLGKLLVMALLRSRETKAAQSEPETVMMDVTFVSSHRAPVVLHTEVAYPVSEADLRGVLNNLDKRTAVS